MTKPTHQPVIGIDARMLGEEQTGIGKYIARLIAHVPQRMPDVRFVVFVREPEFSRLTNLAPNVEKRNVSAHWYSWREQIVLPFQLLAARVDLMHFPHFNVPVLYRRPFVVTIHDITPRFFPGHKMGSLARRAGFWLTFSSAVRRAQKVIAVSRHTRSDVVQHFGAHKQNVAIIPEGVDDAFFPGDKAQSAAALGKYGIAAPYILYVGVWREHKNLVGLLRAYALLRERYHIQHELVLTGKENPFYPAVRKTTAELHLDHHVITPGFVPQQDLVHLYRAASLTIVPSFYEGFGFTGLESLACGTPVAASRIASLPEVLGDAAVYFDPKNVEDMAGTMYRALTDNTLRKCMLENARRILPRYRWETMAEQTAACYRDALAGI